MKPARLLATALLLALLPTGGASAHEPPRPAVLEPGGPYVRGDLPEAPGPGWLALVVGPQASRVVPTRVRVIPDPRGLDPNGEHPALVATDLRRPPALLMRGVPGVRAGAARTSVARPITLDGPAGLAGAQGRVGWRLRVEGRRIGTEEPFMVDGRLVLTQGGRRQVLHDMHGKGEIRPGTWQLLWAGDLDRDGQPDFYLDLRDHYASSERTLFLSSAARGAELVRGVATFSITGD